MAEQLIQRLFKGDIRTDEIDPKYYFAIAEKLKGAVKTGLGVQGRLNPENSKTKLFEKLNNNIYAFSAAKSMTALQEFKKHLTDENGEVVSYGKFRQSVIPLETEFNDNYLKTEYESAVAMAQMAGKWDQLKEYDMLEYRTVGDNRVRKSHQDLDGTRLPPNDPLWAKIYPPNGWGCRCTVIPAQGMEQTGRDTAVDFSKTEIKPYFRRNVGTEQVLFHDDHPYFARMPHDLKKDKTHQFMAEENYGMRSVEQIMKNDELPELSVPKDKATAKKIWEELEKTVTTADGLEWNISDRWDHVVEDHEDENRWQHITNVTDVLQNADEVWTTRQMTNGKMTTFKRYIKYYDGHPVVMSYDIDNPDKWTMYSSSPDNNYENMRTWSRRGVLIYRK